MKIFFSPKLNDYVFMNIGEAYTLKDCPYFLVEYDWGKHSGFMWMACLIELMDIELVAEIVDK
jgi:hypothetical protein